MNPLSRYEPLVDDVPAFRAACNRPLPSVVRINTIKATIDRAKRALDEEGVGYDACEWHPGLLKLDTTKPGNTWPYFHGWLHGQEEVSAFPSLVLDPRPGDRVWDACAAPGSKTTQLSALMNDEGVIVGNDSNLGRLSALRHNAERLGVSNLVVTNQDARNFSLKPLQSGEYGASEPVDIEAFDRTLVDAPCSCEGTCRKNPDVLEQWDADHVKALVGIQKGILRRAVQATSPGGCVVYSTCTFAPEENEAVVDHVLREEACHLVRFDTPLTTAPGVTEWEGERFHPDLRKSHRVYPHQNDTGGFYCAKLVVGDEERAG